jgi:hypothetical protein
LELLIGKAADTRIETEAKSQGQYASESIFGIAQQQLNALRALAKTDK